MVKIGKYNLGKKEGIIIAATAATLGIVGVLAYYYSRPKPISGGGGVLPAIEPATDGYGGGYGGGGSGGGGGMPSCSTDADCRAGYACKDGYCVKTKVYQFSGKVIDKNGKAVPGTPIDVKYGNPSSPQTTSTQTNDNGVYYINITWLGEPPVLASATERTKNITVQKTVTAEGNYTLDDIKFTEAVVWPDLNRRARFPCADNSECPSGMICDNTGNCAPGGQTQPTCASDADCTTPGYICDNVSKLCVLGSRTPTPPNVSGVLSSFSALANGKDVVVSFCSTPTTPDGSEVWINWGDNTPRMKFFINANQCQSNEPKPPHTYGAGISGQIKIRAETPEGGLYIYGTNGLTETTVNIP